MVPRTLEFPSNLMLGEALVPGRGGTYLPGRDLSHMVLRIQQTNYLARQTGAKTRTSYFCTADAWEQTWRSQGLFFFFLSVLLPVLSHIEQVSSLCFSFLLATLFFQKLQDPGLYPKNYDHGFCLFHLSSVSLHNRLSSLLLYYSEHSSHLIQVLFLKVSSPPLHPLDRVTLCSPGDPKPFILPPHSLTMFSEIKSGRHVVIFLPQPLGCLVLIVLQLQL